MSRLLPLVAKAATSRRGGRTLVGPVDLRIDGPGITVLIGPNGAGKTSLLNLLHGTARLSGGRIDWACPIDEARHAQAFVFQRPVMLRRSVVDNIAYPLRIRGVPRREALSRAETAAAQVGLAGMLNRDAPRLSGGEQQKLALARALIIAPDVLFLDEPCASLDGRAMREIEQILIQARASGRRLILSTHDMGQARRLGDDVLFLLRGRLHDSGPAAEFFARPRTSRARAFLQGDIVE
ncbi:sulfate ABC transporter ATP-binding protein [Salipiger aestuarii]|uniref:Tungstate transport system ATP-binding protein n=1 Tax=Salipiger aestuarii TaxID=568098 RepID=A0A327YHI2_9RHOB|nr:ATP-binding cassette domain-containing protein [Salipiger aestuarii]KAA8608870.1 sulfate ABC transporter ATP-binding protein [Salipiger aestuarii]KAA8613174.1 sulfate ABC transporter ATP-binding protein [Salipiger aestuarii]KAB2543074.1 sulfate ABC transporter ATP-binding protein [Salipiger aestuarii]RAK19656.1 tungstate transport system ATP-binding protein [Salipiger aestuarii]